MTNMTKDETKTQSFLHEAQQLGKAGEEMIQIDDLDKAVADISRITQPEGLEMVKSTRVEELPTSVLAIYCHDCRAIVPAQIKQVRRKHRKVCGTCGSVKISAGKEEALIKFYHLEDK